MIWKTFVTQMSEIVTANDVGEKRRIVLPGLPTRGADIAVFSIVLACALLALVACEARFTNVTILAFPAFVTFVTTIASPTQVTRTSARAVCSPIAYTIDAFARVAIWPPLRVQTFAWTQSIGVFPR